MPTLRRLWRLLATAVMGAMLGGMIWAVLGWVRSFVEAPSLFGILTIFPMVLLSLGGGALGLIAIPYTLSGTVLLFWPLCRAFPVRTKASLAVFSAVGAAAGAGLSLVIDDWPSLNGDGSPANPGLVTRLHYGIAFGVGTAMAGWGFMPDREQPDE